MTKVYGLVGHPLGHSFSRGYFTERFQRHGTDAVYLNFDMEDGTEVRRLIETDPRISGLNVTAPHKQAVMAVLDALAPSAQAVGAVNVIAVKRDASGRVFLTGHNTDLAGFAAMLQPLALGAEDSALVCGTGGASRAVCAALRKAGVEVTHVSRTASDNAIAYADIDARIMDTHRIIVNATPLGTAPNTDACPPLPYHLVSPGHIALDVVYNPAVTLFMQKCAQQGAMVKNGLQMLYAQAEAAWDIWTH